MSEQKLSFTREQLEALLPALHTEFDILNDDLTGDSKLLWPDEQNTAFIDGMVQMSRAQLLAQAKEEREAIDKKADRLVHIIEMITRVQLFLGGV